MQSVVGNDPIKTLGETGFAIRPCRLCTTAASRWAGRWGTSASALSVRPAVSVPPPFLCLPTSLPPSSHAMPCTGLPCPARLPVCLPDCSHCRSTQSHFPCPSALGATGGLFPFARPGSWREGALEWGLMRGGCGHGAAGRELPGRKERGEEGSEGEGRKEGGWADGWMAGWMHGRMGGWMGGLMDGGREGQRQAGKV